MQNVWQIAAGDRDHDYADLFLKHDVMFCGPGSPGPFDETVYRKAVADGLFNENKLNRVRRMAIDLHKDDVVLLRSGYTVKAIGVVASDYQYDSRFDDVFGWIVCHSRRVRWQTQHSKELNSIQSKKDLFHGRKQIPTLTRVKEESILKKIEHLFDKVEDRPLHDLPDPPSELLTLDELADQLFAQGVSYDAVHRLKQTVEKQRKLIEWYRLARHCGDRPSEHEIVAHVIIPLLVALGWSEQLLAVEWRKIDLAVFWKTPTDEKHCKMICEAKSIGHGLRDVVEQAKRYAIERPLPECDKILVADGGRFYLYRRKNGQWGSESESPDGYLNIHKIRKRHLCPEGTNAIDTLRALTPPHVSKGEPQVKKTK